MNKSLFLVVFASFAFVVLSQMVGGWQPVDNEDETIQDLVQVATSLPNLLPLFFLKVIAVLC